MKKWYYSIIIISTTVSICVMCLFGSINNVNKQNNMEIEKSNNASTKKEILNQQNNVDIKPLQGSNTDCSQSNQPNNQHKTDTQVTENNNTNTNTASISQSSSENKSQLQSEVSQEYKQNDNSDATEQTVSVFKVKKDDILGSMSFMDKERLFIIAAKLSRTDYNKIANLLKNDKDGQGVISSFKILKDKLSKKDYYKVRSITGKYINLETIDDN